MAQFINDALIGGSKISGAALPAANLVSPGTFAYDTAIGPTYSDGTRWLNVDKLGSGVITPQQFGAVGDGVVNDTVAFQASVTAASTQGKAFRFSGTFKIDTVTIPAGIWDFQGGGTGVAVLKPLGNNTVLQFAGSGLFGGIFGNFSIQGTQAGTGHGFYIQPGSTTFRSKFTRMYISGMGGVGFYENGTTFDSIYENVTCDNCLGHQFDLAGGNATTLIACYVGLCPTAGKAGYRIRSGVPVMSACSGVNSGQYWGMFGQTIALDGVASFCSPVLIGCNIEDYSLVGMQMRNSSPTLINTAFLAPSAGTVSAIAYDTQPNNVGQLINSTFQTKGASYNNSLPIHCRNQIPFGIYTDPTGANPSYTYWDDAGASSNVSSAFGTAGIMFGINATYTNGLKLALGDITPLIFAAGNTGASATPNCTNGYVQSWTLNQNATFAAPTFSSAGQRITLIITSTGAFTATFNAAYKNATGGTFTLAVSANTQKATLVFLNIDGTNFQFIGGSTAFA